ncbi:unknown similar to AMEV260 [Choristoneura rosaceana entomopoxvirus 'L']|uniref:Reverse transcriptase domain-containing protein n=1 Tax=Choristoneura rosaceana entomopoxvirus 'L' TaxID=1293539 RepID=A0ABM9QKB8_9POXV|nr:unknown similar to AMEV260 [Choristoneura rosaceana entomopoxvirus 'L']CCU55992.1 unknown similar to AMEV260 [Choristoneura rosaceana entomopoxvirus 'L']
MEISIEKCYKTNKYQCTICKCSCFKILCKSCKYYKICIKCSYNKQKFYNLNIKHFCDFIYDHLCLNCIINSFFKTNILDFTNNQNILNQLDAYNCIHIQNLFDIFLNMINKIENINYIQYYKDFTQNSSTSNLIFEYKNKNIFDKKCFICMVNYIKNNYNNYKLIFDNIILKLSTNNFDFVINNIPLNILKGITNSYVIKKKTTDILNNNDCIIKIITVLKNKQYTNYNIDKNNDSKLKIFESMIIRTFGKKTYIRTEQYKHYIYLKLKNIIYKNLLINLQNINIYNINEEIFNKIYIINDYYKVLKNVSSIIKKHKYKYVVTLDILNAYTSIKKNYLYKVINSYIINNDIKLSIEKYLNLINDNFKIIYPQNNVLYLNKISLYLFKLCMYDIINNSTISGVEFVCMCDDIILLSNSFENITHMTYILITNLNKNNMSLNYDKLRIYKTGMQNIYFLNNVIYPSNNLRRIIRKWVHITYKEGSKSYNRLVEKYNNIKL